MKILLNNGEVWDKERIQALIDQSDAAVARALMVVYANQTEDERRSGNTIHHNSIGFTGCDAEVLTDIAKKWKQWGRWASKRQANFVRRKVRKYHRQILQHMLDTKPDARKVSAVEVKRLVQQEPVIEPSPVDPVEDRFETPFHRFAG